MECLCRPREGYSNHNRFVKGVAFYIVSCDVLFPKSNLKFHVQIDLRWSLNGYTTSLVGRFTKFVADRNTHFRIVAKKSLICTDTFWTPPCSRTIIVQGLSGVNTKPFKLLPLLAMAMLDMEVCHGRFDRKYFTHSSLKPVSLITSSSVAESRNIPTTVFMTKPIGFKLFKLTKFGWRLLSFIFPVGPC